MAVEQHIVADGGASMASVVLLFAVAGLAMALGALIFGRWFRPNRPGEVKNQSYECGEPAFGSAWVQFDLRFYVVALVFLILDVELALFYPWAVVFGGGGDPKVSAEALQPIRVAALWDMLFFFGVIVVGFLYLWRFGYLDWVRAYAPQRSGTEPGGDAPSAPSMTPRE